MPLVFHESLDESDHDTVDGPIAEGQSSISDVNRFTLSSGEVNNNLSIPVHLAPRPNLSVSGDDTEMVGDFEDDAAMVDSIATRSVNRGPVC